VAKLILVRFLLSAANASLEQSRPSLLESLTASDPVLTDSISDTKSEPFLRFLLLCKYDVFP